MKLNMKLKEKVILYLIITTGLILFTPYVYDVFTDSIQSIVHYLNPLAFISFYTENSQVLLILILVPLLFMLLSSNNNHERLLVDEDVSREATKDEVKKEFKSMDISKPFPRYKKENMEKLPCNEKGSNL